MASRKRSSEDPHMHAHSEKKFKIEGPNHDYEPTMCGLMHVLSVKEYNSALLALPAELRNKIYQMVFEEDGHNIKVRSCKFPEPPLLLACKQIRREAGHLLYSEFTFDIPAGNNTDAWLVSKQKSRKIIAEFDLRPKYKYVPDATISWRDLMVTLRRRHKGYIGDNEFYPYQLHQGRFGPATVVHDTIRSLELTVQELRDLPWSRVERLLEQRHTILVLADRRWA